MPKPRPPYLLREKTRHGSFVWYVRKGTGPRIRINGVFDSPEFKEAYLAALAGVAWKPTQARTGTLQWLYDRYRDSTKWSDLSIATRDQRENIFGHVMETAGDKEFGNVTRKHIEDGKDRRRGTPSQARNYLDAMRGLFRWALENRHVKLDPTVGVKNPPRKATEGFKAWDLEDVAKYEARWPEGSKERVWLHVLLYIGSRRGDAVTHGRQHVRNGVLTFITEKGRDKERIEVTRRIEPELAATLARGPCADLAFICGDRGKPLTKESFGNGFKEACVAAGILDKSAHGLRKLSATLWAERGATENELMAMFGWLSPSMAALYTRKARRRLMSLSASDRLRTTPQHSIPAPLNEVRGTEKIAK